MFARTLIGGQISMTVGLLGVIISIVLGSILGTLRLLYGVCRRCDPALHGSDQFFPHHSLVGSPGGSFTTGFGTFMALDRYFLITVVLSLVGWTGLARQLRAKVMAYRSADFCQAAVAAGASDARIIFVHMLLMQPATLLCQPL